MSIFEYKALQTDGTMSNGSLEAEGRQDAIRKLSAKGLKPVNLTEQAKVKSKAESGNSGLFKAHKVTSRMLEDFTRLLSSLLASGIPLSRALFILCKESSAAVASQNGRKFTTG